MKKLLLSLSLLLLLQAPAWAYDFYARNSDGQTIYYNIVNGYSKRACEVTSVSSQYSSYTGKIVIPDTVSSGSTEYMVVSIGYKAFYYCGGLTSVTLPNSLEKIDDYAFAGCSLRNSLTIPSNVKTIGNGAFIECQELTQFHVAEDNEYFCEENGVLYTKDMATLVSFPPASSLLPSYEIPNSTNAIGDFAFWNCTGLTEVTIPSSVKTIGWCAFYQCTGLISATIPNGVETIGSQAFYECKNLSSLTIPNSVTSIGDYAFQSCKSLTGSLAIPNSVTEIGESAFYNCSGLTEIILPNSLTKITASMISYCSGLTQIIIPESVTEIGYYAFSYCTGLTEVIIPDSVTAIGNYAFWGCSELTQVTIGNSVISIEEYAFRSCSGLTKVNFNATACQFAGSRSSNAAKRSFNDCVNIAVVNIGDNVTMLPDYLFSECKAMESIYSLNPEPPSCGKYVFNKVPKSTCILYVPIGSKEAYSTASQWKDFQNIVEIDVSPVNSIAANGNVEAVSYYTTDGKQVPTLQRGINIIRYSDGTAKKVLVK